MTTKSPGKQNTNARQPNGKAAALKAAEDALTPDEIAQREAREKAHAEQEKINKAAAEAQAKQEKKEAAAKAKADKAIADRLAAREKEPNCMDITITVTGNDGKKSKQELTLANLRSCMLASKMNDTASIQAMFRDVLVKSFGAANVK